MLWVSKGQSLTWRQCESIRDIGYGLLSSRLLREWKTYIGEKMRGIKGNGMILMAEDADATLQFVNPDLVVSNGSGVS